MNYTVVWKPAAHAELAEIWTSAQDRQAVADAANQIDQLLKTDPRQQGESRSGTMRIVFVEPIGIIFDVNEGDRLVSIAHVWIM